MSLRSGVARLAARHLGPFGIVLSCSWSCAGHSDALARGQRYYEDNQYERALALWRDLDRRGAAFSPRERARYAYFRGMTDYRLGFRDDARHWLAIAKAADARQPGALAPSWLERLEGALMDLGREALGLRPDGSDVVQTIEMPAVRAASDATRDDDAAVDTRPAPSVTQEAARQRRPGDAAPTDAAPTDAAPTDAMPAGEPLPTDPGPRPLPAPRR